MKPEYRRHAFGYAHDEATIRALQSKARQSKTAIEESYAFIEEPGQHSAFDSMIEIAKQATGDILYVYSIKELAGRSLAEFKANLTAIHEAGMDVRFFRSSEKYDYYYYITAIEIIEELMPIYQKSQAATLAVAMHLMGADLATICEKTKLRKSEVYRALAEYAEREEAKTGQNDAE